MRGCICVFRWNEEGKRDKGKKWSAEDTPINMDEREASVADAAVLRVSNECTLIPCLPGVEWCLPRNISSQLARQHRRWVLTSAGYMHTQTNTQVEQQNA